MWAVPRVGVAFGSVLLLRGLPREGHGYRWSEAHTPLSMGSWGRGASILEGIWAGTSGRGKSCEVPTSIRHPAQAEGLGKQNDGPSFQVIWAAVEGHQPCRAQG